MFDVNAHLILVADEEKRMINNNYCYSEFRAEHWKECVQRDVVLYFSAAETLKHIARRRKHG